MRRIQILILLLLIVLLTGCSSAENAVSMPTATLEASAESTPTPSPAPTPTVESEIVFRQYSTIDYSTMKEITKDMAVYVPKGYSYDSKYNVAIALHTSGADENFWPSLGVKDILDELIETDQIEPTLVFMPDCYINETDRAHHDGDGVYVQFSQELRNDIIPYIQNTYSVSDDRDDYACLGASFGAYMTVNSVLSTNLDLFSNFGYIGGGTISLEKLESSWEKYGTQDLNIKMLYIGEGEMDDRGPVELSYLNLKAYHEKFDDKNLVFSLIEYAGHNQYEWKYGFFEGMKLFFGADK